MARDAAKPRSRTKGAVSALLSEPAAIIGPRLIFILSVVLLCIFGLIMVYSSSSIVAYNEHSDSAYFIKRQALFLVLGLILCIVCARLPYKLWSRPPVVITLWAISVVLLTLTAFGMGVSALGAERSIVIAGFALQPAEFAKIAVLMAAASIFQMHMEGVLDNRRFIVFILIATVIPLILIYRQPDLGSAIILAVGIIALALLAGISWKIIFAILGILMLYVIFACVTQPYHLERITSMFNPWLDPQGKGYQSIQSLYAFGNGGIFGTGLGLSRQKYLYLPYAHTDFIFAIVGEELGLIGSVSLVLLFGVFVFAGMRIARNAPDIFGCMLAGSFTVMIGFQACVNMACVAGIAPVTGKALPLISYGGSSMIATMIMIGIILSVSFSSRVGAAYERRRDNFMVIDGGEGPDSDGVYYEEDRYVDDDRGKVIDLRSARRTRSVRTSDPSTSGHVRSSRSRRYSKTQDSGTGSLKRTSSRDTEPPRSKRRSKPEDRSSRTGRLPWEDEETDAFLSQDFSGTSSSDNAQKGYAALRPKKK